MQYLKSDFYYDLPEEQIAQTPAEPRDSSRLLVYDRSTDKTEHRIFRDVADYLKAGDVLVGMASSGVHSNGFSLVRSVFEMTKESLDTYYEELHKTLGEALIEPTKIYVKALKSMKNNGIRVKGCSHITGGGFYENVPRMLPDGIRAVIEKNSYEVPAIFKLLAKKGDIAEDMMYHTFNMGLGMVIAVAPEDKEKVLEAIAAAGEKAYVVGYTQKGEKGVTLC